MSLINLCGFETGDLGEALSTSGTGISVQSSNVRTGTYSLKSAPVGAGSGYYELGDPVQISSGLHQGFKVGVGMATGYYRFYFEWTTKPAANDEPFFLVVGTATDAKLELRLTSGGVIKAYDSTNTLVGTGATVLSASTEYLIEVKCGTGASAAWEVKINGVSEISASNSNLTTHNNARIYLGKWTNRNGNSVVFYYDDVAVSDSGYLGAGQCKVMVPVGDGTYTNWTVGAGAGAKWQQLGEIPNDGDTTYDVSDHVIGHAYTATLQTAAAAGINAQTINGVKPIWYLKKDGAGDGQVKLRLRSGSTDSDTATTLDVSVGSYTEIDQIYTTDPATSAAWLPSALSALQIGGVEETNSATAQTRFTAMYVMVDYVPLPALDLNICGFELGDLASETPLWTPDAPGVIAPVVQGTTKHTGSYALRHNVSVGTSSGYALYATRNATTGGVSLGTFPNYNLATAYAGVYFRYHTKPSSTDDSFMAIFDNANTMKLDLRLNSAGNIVAYDSTGALLGTGATVLAVDTFYEIEIACASGGAGAYTVYINGVSELTGTGNLGSNNGSVALGKWHDVHHNVVDFFYDNLYISSQGNLLVAHQVVAVSASADGTYTNWTIGAGSGSKFQQVNEIPPNSDTSYLLSDSTVGHPYTALFNCNVFGPKDVVNAVKSVVQIRQNAGSSGAIKLRFRSGATNTDTASSLTPTPIYRIAEQLFTTDPNTSAAWATANMSALEAGAIEEDSVNSHKTRMTNVVLMVDFTPGSAASFSTTVTGTLTPAGAFHAAPSFIASGTLSFIGAAPVTKSAVVAATLSPVSRLILTPIFVKTATLTPTAVAINFSHIHYVAPPLAGTLSPTGALGPFKVSAHYTALLNPAATFKAKITIGAALTALLSPIARIITAVGVIPCNIVVGDLRQRVWERLDDDGTYYPAARVLHALNVTQRLWCLITLAYEKTVTFNLTAATPFYTLSSQIADFMVPLRVMYNGKRLRTATLNQLSRFGTWRATPGIATHYFQQGIDLFALYPQPRNTDPLTLALTYAAVPPDMVADTDSPIISVENQPYLVDGAIYWLRLFEGMAELKLTEPFWERFMVGAQTYVGYVRARAKAQMYDISPPFDLATFDQGGVPPSSRPVTQASL